MTETRPDIARMRADLESVARGLDVPADGALGRVSFQPVIHGRLELASAVRARFVDASPEIDCVAVEVAETLEAAFVRAVAALPSPVAIRWRDREDRGHATLLVHPCDPACEAARLAQEHGIRLACVDADVEGYPALYSAAPDPAVIARVGADAYVGAWLRWPPRAAGETEDARSGAAAARDRRREATMAFHLRTLRERHRHVLFVCGIDHALGVRELVVAESMARPLGRVRRDGVRIFSLSQRTLENDLLPEPPYLQAAYERARRADGPVEIDRLRALGELFLAARDRQRVEDGDAPNTAALRIASVFARNLALIGGRLAPDLYDALIAARGVSDDFAYHVWHLATVDPWRESRATGLPEIDLSLEEIGHDHRVLRFERRTKARRHALRLVRPRTRERRPGEWKERWDGAQLCSHTPDDVRIEAFGALMRKSTASIISSERARVAPFVASLLDGVDLRETIRNMPHDGRLFVREEQPIRGKVGAVMLVFDEDRAEGGQSERFPYAMTWQGEHEQESDMALYATEPGGRMIGPGIARCEYGGLLMTYPPGRMFGVWEDPFFAQARSKPERLLLAAIDYCVDRLIVYVGPRPPAERAVTRARRSGKRVLFVPIGSMSPVTLARLRTFHVLDGHHVRSYAKEHIG